MVIDWRRINQTGGAMVQLISHKNHHHSPLTTTIHTPTQLPFLPFFLFFLKQNQTNPTRFSSFAICPLLSFSVKNPPLKPATYLFPLLLQKQLLGLRDFFTRKIFDAGCYGSWWCYKKWVDIHFVNGGQQPSLVLWGFF